MVVAGAATFTVAHFLVWVDLAFKPESFEISTLMALLGLGTGGFAGSPGL